MKGPVANPAADNVAGPKVRQQGGRRNRQNPILIFQATRFIRLFVTGLSQFRREFVIWNAQFTLTWIFQKRLPTIHGRGVSG